MPTQRIAWDFVDPEVMEMAANSLAARHPELSWDRLMGDTAWNEQAGRDFADRIIGKAAATRHCATSSTPSCATTTDRRANPGADPRADGRAKSGDAGNGAGNQPEPTPDETQSKDPQQQTQHRTNAPKPDGKEQKPKPIRSKKALLERFKTRLNENLTEQKNHMPPTQNRDRTPRKAAERKPQ